LTGRSMTKAMSFFSTSAAGFENPLGFIRKALLRTCGFKLHGNNFFFEMNYSSKMSCTENLLAICYARGPEDCRVTAFSAILSEIVERI
jgi:hypothetical protein